MVLWLVVGALVGVLVGAAACAAVLAARGAAARVVHAGELARAEARLEEERRASEERQRSWEEARRQLTGEFAELSAAALDRNARQFLDLADARLGTTRQEASGDLDQRRQAIEQLVAPLRDQLGKYEEIVRTIEGQRQQAYVRLTEQVRSLSEGQDKLQNETRNLVTALRAPQTRGRWGEVQLRRVVELAGMVDHCDFDEQVTTDTDDGRVRPDMVVHLPGSKSVVIDAKVPLDAFLNAQEEQDAQARAGFMQNHARQLRTHVDALSKKAYWQQFDQTPEFVVAFIPSEALLAAACEHDPTLLEHAMASKVTLATPMTLIALLRTVAASWQQEALADSARQVRSIGRELYKRLDTFREHMAKVGNGLNRAVEHYNKAVGSLERSVLPQARRFDELGVGVGERRLEELNEVETSARIPELPASGPSLELVEPTPPEHLPDVAQG